MKLFKTVALTTLGIVAAVAVLYFVIELGPRYDWTGFGESEIKKDVVPRKTLWDWLDLLVIPLVLVLVALFFRRAAAKTERELAEERREQETLDSYYKEMSELLLEHELGMPASDERTLVVARSLTLTILRRLRNPVRKSSVVLFLRDADLIAGRNGLLANADLRGVDLSEANLSEANLRRANLSKANLHKANLSTADLSKANLRRADLRFANLGGADLRGATSIRAYLGAADLSGADLSKANLREAELIAADLSGADLSQSDLSKARLFGSNLRKADLRYAVLRWAMLKGADLRGADLCQAKLDGADLSKANLREADLGAAGNLTCKQLTRAENWELAYRNIDCGEPIPERSSDEEEEAPTE